MVEKLKKYISQFVLLSTEEVEQMNNYFEPLTLKRGDVWVREGKTGRHLGFILNGYMRKFVFETEAEETIHISPPGEFIIPFYSFLCRLKNRVVC